MVRIDELKSSCILCLQTLVDSKESVSKFVDDNRKQLETALRHSKLPVTLSELISTLKNEIIGDEQRELEYEVGILRRNLNFILRTTKRSSVDKIDNHIYFTEHFLDFTQEIKEKLNDTVLNFTSQSYPGKINIARYKSEIVVVKDYYSDYFVVVEIGEKILVENLIGLRVLINVNGMHEFRKDFDDFVRCDKSEQDLTEIVTTDHVFELHFKELNRQKPSHFMFYNAKNSARYKFFDFEWK